MEKLYYYIAQQLAENPQVVDSASASPEQGLSSWSLFMMVGVFAVMYFLLIRPQRKEEKRKKEMITALKKGDSVITTSGIKGTIASIKPDSIFLNVGDNTRIEFLRSAVSQVVVPESTSGKK